MSVKSDPKPPTEGARSLSGAERDRRVLTEDIVQSPWLERARTAFNDSTDWLEANLQGQWERNVSNFRSQHPSNSKYNTAHYRFRSKVFRPKTRSARKALEANAAIAFFTNHDRLDIKPVNTADPAQRVAARMIKEIADIRLRQTIPWFQILMGGVQDAGKHGVVISHQYWDIRQKEFTTENVTDLGTKLPRREKILERDEPVIELVAPENIRIDPAANWLDPINSSPYLIHIVPMYVLDVIDMIDNDDNVKWKDDITVARLLASKDSVENAKGLRQAREAPRQDRHDDQYVTDDRHDTVWIHKNFIRDGGEDYVFYTAGTTMMLSDPVPIYEHYPHLKPGERPFTMGVASLESHVVYPQSPVEQGEQLQQAINEITNQRIDNVRLAMDGRYLIRRNRNIDLTAVRHSVPGGLAECDDPDSDIRMLETKDVTGSAYMEQDRANLEFDDLAGAFSGATVQGNRRMNETVGGMRLLSANASLVSEYEIRTITETWVRPVMRQLVTMIQFYETDEQIITNAAMAARAHHVMDSPEQVEELMRTPITVDISLGLGATDPVQKVNNLLLAIQNAVSVPGVANYINGFEVSKELFSILGYGDADRFLHELDNNPVVMELQQEIARLTQIIETDQQKHENMKEITMMRSQNAERIQTMKMQVDLLDKLIKDEAEETKRGELELQKAALLDSMQKWEMELGRERYLEKITGSTNPPGFSTGKSGVVSRDDYASIPHAKG